VRDQNNQCSTVMVSTLHQSPDCLPYHPCGEAESATVLKGVIRAGEMRCSGFDGTGLRPVYSFLMPRSGQAATGHWLDSPVKNLIAADLFYESSQIKVAPMFHDFPILEPFNIDP